jgi:plastocyanin
MAQVLSHQGSRCQEHPHRSTENRCDRCRQPFCDDCLSPGRRRTDGTRGWYCALCLAKTTDEEAAVERERTVAARVVRAKRRLRISLIVASGIGIFLLSGAVMVRFFAGSSAAGGMLLSAETTRCGELTRIRSVGAIGTQGADDSVNILAYPQRAEVKVTAVGGRGGPEAGLPALPAGGSGAEPDSIVDECDSGWHFPDKVTLPVTLTLDTRRAGSYVQRLAFWQDPKAPKSAWVLEFEVFASTSETGSDFVPLLFDRPTRLRESTEPQWFEIMRPGPHAAAPPFPDAVPIRRLQVRILSTYGSPRLRSDAEGVSLGEVAAYGPDLELSVSDVPDTTNFTFKPSEVRALAGQPKFVLFMNQSRTAHHLVTVGQTRNLDLKVEPGQAVSGQFIAAARTGRYELMCRIPGHDRLGLVGSIVVR